MSDLHRPATLLVARHGDANYGGAPNELTDHGGWLTPHGREQAVALGHSLAGRGVAAAYASRLGRAIETATLAGGVLGLGPVTAVDGLQEFRMGDLVGSPYDDPRLMQAYTAWIHGDLDHRMPGAESGDEILARYREGLLTVADQHRGETVLVVSHGGAMCFALPRLAGNVADDLMPGPTIANCAVAEIAVGDDGIEMVRWPSERADVAFGSAVEHQG